MLAKKEKNIKYIMGIQSFSNMDSGASIVKCSTDGEILEYVAISEERLICKKYPYVFPVHSIGYCMDYFGLTDLNEIDLLMTDYIRIKRWFQSGPTYNTSDYDYLKIKFNIDLRKIRIITHHMAHAASTYYASGFDEAAILIVDGNGSDLETTSYFIGKGFDINLIENYKYHGIGACYTAVTKGVLNFGTGGEGKTMGLAPYGEKYNRVLHIDAKLDGIKNNFSNFMIRMPYSDVLNQLDPKNRINPIKWEYKKCEDKKELLNPYYSSIAYCLQKETERVLIHLAKDLNNKTGMKNLCVSGGVGLNSVSNKLMLDKSGFEDIFIFPACSDAGIPFGLAIWGYYNCKEIGSFKKRPLSFKNTYTGISYSDSTIEDMLSRHGIPYKKLELRLVANLIAEGKIVGWFQGGSEYGPRALGHRSILADSRNKEMIDILNIRVKHREPFRPFAPAILKEHCSDYFDIKNDSPYMLLIAQVKNPAAIPSVTHVDNSARIQTVTKENNDIFYDLIQEFYHITGVPCILNTSFNDAGDPIVETPEDAVICFLKCNIDYLVLGNYVIHIKEVKKDNILDNMIQERVDKIKKREVELKEKYFSGYDEKERDYFISESNKISEWHVKYKCMYELEKKVLDWTENDKKLLVIGTPDHTNILLKKIKGFINVNVIGYCQFKAYDKKPCNETMYYKVMKIDELNKINYDEVLISSWEYNFEIYEYLIEKKLNEKPIYMIYDNTSRNLMDILINYPSYQTIYND